MRELRVLPNSVEGPDEIHQHGLVLDIVFLHSSSVELHCSEVEGDCP